jgi:hypothetical protein
LQFLEGKIDKIVHAQEIKPKAKVVKYLVYPAEPWLAANEPASQRPNQAVSWHPPINLRRLPVIEAESAHEEYLSGQQQLSMNATSLHLQYKVVVPGPVASSVAPSDSAGSITQVVADVPLVVASLRTQQPFEIEH